MQTKYFAGIIYSSLSNPVLQMRWLRPRAGKNFPNTSSDEPAVAGLRESESRSVVSDSLSQVAQMNLALVYLCSLFCLH